MSGRRRRRRTHAGNRATAEGESHQVGGGGGEGGSSDKPIASDDPMAGAREAVGGGGGGGVVRTPTAATPEDGGVQHGAEGGEGGSDGVLPAAATVAVDGQPRAPARTAEEWQCQVAADGSGQFGDAQSSGDHAVVSRKGGCLLNEDEEVVITDQVTNSWSGGGFLLDAVMTWGVADVLNADLFKNKVQNIPSIFSSVQQYLDIYMNHLLEETRASIHLGLLDLAKGQTYHALSVSQTATSSVYFVDIDIKISSDCSHIAEDGDLFLLSTQPDGEFDHTSACFAIATEVGRFSCFQKSFRVLVCKYDKDFDFQAIKHVSFLTNIMGGIILSKAMSSVEHGSSAAVESILWINEKAKTQVCSCGELALDEFSPPKKFNDKQINALTCTLSKLRCPHFNAPEVLWGPPGSGKTELAAAMIHSLFHLKFRVLVCIPREKDIRRFLHKFKVLFPSFNLSDMLVLNEMNGVGDTFAKMSLENRSHQLYCSTYTWRSWMKELAFVLQMEPYCQDSCHHEGQVCKKNNQIVFCLDSFRRKICALILDLKESSEDLISSLAGKCFFDNDVAKINDLMTELSEFQNLLLNGGVTSFDVQCAFQFPSSLHLVSEISKRSIAKSMNAKRVSCLRLMENLIDSFELPQLEDRKELEDFCLGHSRIIISTPSYSSRLLKLKLTPFDLLLVDDASQIKESDLLIPLSMEPKHVVLLGDHLHLQPTVKSEVCKETGYASSLFERLLRLSSEKMILTKQYVMHPSISLFVRDHFYAGVGEDACIVLRDDYNKQVDQDKFAPYGFFDITNVNELKEKGKGFVECAAIIFLLQKLCRGLNNGIGKLSVGILCLCSSRVDMINNRLGAEYGSHDRINIEVNTLDNSNKDWYDIVILSAVSDANSEIPKGNRINTALTKSRHCLWIICEATSLIDSGGTWKLLVHNAMERKKFAKLTSQRLSNVMKKLEVNDQRRLTATISSCTRNILQKPGQEWTWQGRPNNTKDILGSLRDQKNARDTCTLQATLSTTESLNKFQWSCLDPPQDFPWELCFNDLKSKYEKVVNEEIASEEIGEKRGKIRQETAFEIAKTQGIIGRDKSETEEEERGERVFKLESYERVDKTLEAEEAELVVESGSPMVCNFRLSRNYFRLRPGDVYVYDRRYPYIHPKSGLPVAHAVTVIGHGGTPPPQPTPPRPKVRHVHFQNSEGKRFGDDGFGRIARESVRGLYRLTVPPAAAATATAAPSPVGPAAAAN